MPLEGHSVTDAHTAGGLEDLSIGILAVHLDDLAHEGDTVYGDVADLVLRHRPIGLDRHEVTDDPLYYTFCCHSIVILSIFLDYAMGALACPSGAGSA